MAQNLGLNIELMAELLPVGIQGIKAGMRDMSENGSN